jgi:quinol monooxygenase YgiN
MLAIMAAVTVMTIEFEVAPEKREDFVAITAEVVPAVRALEGNLQFDVLLDETRPNTVVYLERWETKAQQEAFYEWWVERGMTEKLRPLVTAAPKVSAYVQAVE